MRVHCAARVRVKCESFLSIKEALAKRRRKCKVLKNKLFSNAKIFHPMANEAVFKVFLKMHLASARKPVLILKKKKRSKMSECEKALWCLVPRKKFLRSQSAGVECGSKKCLQAPKI